MDKRKCLYYKYLSNHSQAPYNPFIDPLAASAPFDSVASHISSLLTSEVPESFKVHASK